MKSQHPVHRSSALPQVVLLGSCLGLAAGFGCSASNDDAAGGDVSRVDDNNDGVVDSLGVTIDADADGVADVFDFHGDGSIVGVGVDTNGDGKFDAIGHDTNDDGVLDALDTDGDGKPDKFATVEPGGDGDVEDDIVIVPNDDPSSDGCNEFDISFEQTIPNVILLVDQSGSMWENKAADGKSFWESLKPALLDVVQQYQSEISFQFKSYTSADNVGPKRSATCPMYVESGAPALNSYAAIEAAYNGISVLEESETPTVYALGDALATLTALPGNSHIVLVTDGQPDYCDDNHNECAIEETIGVIQKAYDARIGTSVVGLVSGDAALSANLQKFANAGAGVGIAGGGKDFNWCWNNIYSGTAMFPPTYTTDGPPAPVHIPADQNTESLKAAMAGVLKGVKSCSFELGDELKIIAAEAHRGGVFLQRGEQEEKLVFEDANGWTLSGESEVTLTGTGCTGLQAEDVTGIRFDFPCDIVTVVK